MSIIDELEIIRNRDPNKVLYPEAVVNFARDSATELHQRFIWDNDEAADAYRLEQARLIIRVNVRLVENQDGDEVNVRAYVALDKERHGYQDVRVVLSKPKKRRELIESILDRFEATLKNHEPLHELNGIRDAIAKCRRGLSGSKSPPAKPPKSPKGSNMHATV